ncbi:hypothetical protein BayCH28_19070 [Mycolicibacterium sp. CH28]|uniref:hypothetical protein n=1 Tax=Mycolicibacterium sp. CH28 TaxID=2512237 RepID=UPI001081247D|nr:hypothetical protein [Mycolicibacterium sp. CH28]TGD85803.1 hypothetical protein BayCH28_19070 [Mycolicibacterium sp. CH28]
MNFAHSAQRSSIAAVAALGAAAAISVSAIAAGPLVANAVLRLSASSVAAEVSSTIRDVLAATHTSVQSDRADIVTGRQTIRDTRHQSVSAIGASILAGSVGDGQVSTILSDAHSANTAQRQTNTADRTDIHQTRQGAASDIVTIFAGNHDGSTVQDVKAIIATAKKDNAMVRSTIVADVQENVAIRHTTAAADRAVRQSARAGDITGQEAAQQISAQRNAAHTDIADSRAQMVTSHKQITATRQEAAHNVAKTVHNRHSGD